MIFVLLAIPLRSYTKPFIHHGRFSRSDSSE